MQTMQRPEDFTVQKEALQQLTHSICQGYGCRWGRREVNVWWHLIIYPCDMDGVGMRKLHMWAKVMLSPSC